MRTVVIITNNVNIFNIKGDICRYAKKQGHKLLSKTNELFIFENSEVLFLDYSKSNIEKAYKKYANKEDIYLWVTKHDYIETEKLNKFYIDVANANYIKGAIYLDEIYADIFNLDFDKYYKVNTASLEIKQVSICNKTVQPSSVAARLFTEKSKAKEYLKKYIQEKVIELNSKLDMYNDVLNKINKRD